MTGSIEIIIYILIAAFGSTIMFVKTKLLRQIHTVAVFVIAVVGFILGFYGAGIAAIGLLVGDVFLLSNLLSTDHLFSILQVRGSNEYLGAFIEYHKKEIYHFSPFYKRNPESTCFLILNKIDVVGVFIVTVQDKKTLYIDLDFVIDGFRDYSVGNFLFIEKNKYFKDLGYERIHTVCLNEVHKVYLITMGFEERDINGERLFVKNIK